MDKDTGHIVASGFGTKYWFFFSQNGIDYGIYYAKPVKLIFQPSNFDYLETYRAAARELEEMTHKPSKWFKVVAEVEAISEPINGVVNVRYLMPGMLNQAITVRGINIEEENFSTMLGLEISAVMERLPAGYAHYVNEHVDHVRIKV